MKTIVACLLLACLLLACSGPVVEYGDYVLVLYTGKYQNGTVFDSNDPNLAEQFPGRTPLAVRIGSGTVVRGFENALLGMKEGETKNVNLDAKEAYGTYDASLIAHVPKEQVIPLLLIINRDVVVPLSELQQAQSAELGMILETDNFFYNITQLNTTHASLYIVNTTQDPIDLGPWTSKLIGSTSDIFTFRHNIQDGQEYSTPEGPYIASVNSTHAVLKTAFRVGQHFRTGIGTGRVIRETDDTVTVDFNHPLAGKDLDFTITIKTLQKKT